MTRCNFYIDGAWVEPLGAHTVHPIVSPGDEAVVGEVLMGSADDAKRAVAAAKKAFVSYSQTTVAYRTEMGAPWDWAYDALADCGPGHI
jgi:aldehyde dehydrogenase (NAD+)